jgi:hypothetical protein
LPKLEPSAHIPWQKTMLGLVVFIENLPLFDFVALLPAFSLFVRWTLTFLRHPCSDVG